MKINGNPDGGGGGAAVWGGITGNINSQADLNEQFAKKNGLKTINNESIVGSGNIEVGGLDPEQEAAVDILVNAYEGVLYTSVLGPYSVSEKLMSAPEINDSYKIFDVGGGDIYYAYGSDLYKYNSDINDFEKVATFDGGLSLDAGIWKDNTGRLYVNKDFQLDIENQTYTYIESQTGYNIDAAYNDYNRVNIFIGNKGIYNLSTPFWGSSQSYKFKEDTQTFNTGQNIAGDIKQGIRLIPWFKYKDHYLFSYNDNIYEISEGDDEVLTTSNVTDTYFSTIDTSVLGWSTNDYNYFVKDGVLYYLNADPSGNEDTVIYVYNETTQVWDTHTLNDTKLEEGRFVISGDLLISPSFDHSKMYIVNISSSTSVNTFWASNVDQISFNNGAVITTEDSNIKVMAPDLILNDKPVATKDFCLYNNVPDLPGPEFNVECTFPSSGGGVDMSWKMFYTTPGGRVVHINDYRNVCFEYDDNNKVWNVLSTVTNIVSTPYRALVDVEGNGVKLWVARNGVAYKWNDTTGDFDYIIATPDGIDDIWAGDGTTLRCGSGYVLSYDNGNDTYSWVSATYVFPYTIEIFSYIINDTTYVYAQTDPSIFMWNESTGMLIQVGEMMNTPKGDGLYLAQVGNYLYYYNPDGGINRIDVSTTDPDLFDTVTDAFVGSAQWDNIPPLIEYNGKCWTGDHVSSSNYNWGWTGSITPTPIEAPQTNGTYVLKATVLNGQVTYSWVADV